jgi:putative ABC transport system ATP-binding protein
MGLTRIPAENAELLAFDGVSFAVDADREILHGVSLSVAPAAVTVLAGPSGAGKSTLLRLGNRLEVPSVGSVRFRGEDSAVIDPRELRRRVGMVFQKPVPFAGSVRENLRVGAPQASDEELGRSLERVGLEASLLDRVADDLSGGEAQRMCIARTLLTQPEVILMDEPTTGLDPVSRRQSHGTTSPLRTCAAKAWPYNGPICWTAPYEHQPTHLHRHPGGACPAG